MESIPMWYIYWLNETFHLFHLCRISLGMISSHSTFCCHSSCISSLGSNVNGVSILIGSNRELINANIPLLVSSKTLSVGLIDGRSVPKFHKMPSTFSVCTWFYEISGDISEYGKVSKNDLLLDSHFVNLKPPFDNTFDNCFSGSWQSFYTWMWT